MTDLIPEAKGICAECMKFKIQRTSNGIFVYCPENQSGAYMPIGKSGDLIGLWNLMSPIKKEFAEAYFPLFLLQAAQIMPAMPALENKPEKETNNAIH